MADTDHTHKNPGTAKRTVTILVRFIMSGFMVASIILATLIMVGLQPVSTNPVSLDRMITIPRGISGRKIARLLEEEGIVRNAELFQRLLRLTRTDSNLQAGYYLLNPFMSPLRIIKQLNEGQVIASTVIIPEGYELKQIAAVLASAGLVDEERFLHLARNAYFVYGDRVPIEVPIASLEGYLFPDTYQFVKGQTEEAILRHMVNRFLAVVPPIVDPRVAESGLTLHEVVTLASIVEKEAMVDCERPVVAGVYLNRLAINMPLQADPTVRYVMTEERSRVLYRDLDIDSPYNTYRNSGLPPGPIASPGIRSILAVLDPAEVEYLFFVSRRDGTHQFSYTFEEHVRARQALGY